MTEGANFGDPRRRVRARFTLHNIPYNLSVTDPVIKREYLAKPDGEYPIPEALLCVSLAEPHTDGYAYKIVATVITPQRTP